MSIAIDERKTEGNPALVAVKKRRLERALIAFSILAIIGLTMLQAYVVKLGAGVPTSHGILVFVLINVNILLLFFLLVLVLRNLYKIFFEERQLFGAQLRTKLVVAFVSLSMLPTALLFYSALQFIATGHDYWFDENVERSLVDALTLAEQAEEISRQMTIRSGEGLEKELITRQLYRPDNRTLLDEYIQQCRRRLHLALIEVYQSDLKLMAADLAPDIETWGLPSTASSLFTEAAAQNRPQTKVESSWGRDIIWVVWPLRIEDRDLVGYLVIGVESQNPIALKIQAVAKGLEAYRELKRLHDPIRVSHFIALTIVALLSLFISTWIAFHLAKSITGPIMELATGTERIAQGDYDFTISLAATAGEIGTLVQSFNRMTRDLRVGKAELTAKHSELRQSNAELEHRRRYMETILQSVAAGVVAADASGVVTTFNNSAEEILHMKAENILGRNFQEFTAPEHRAVLDDLIRQAGQSPRGWAEKQVRVRIAGQGVSLLVHLTQLRDENDLGVGLVIVFDDLTELEKAQRMAAWREVARRIAHEIKNPLTPIQLSTQRLRRRYADLLGDEGQLFDECTQMIIRQVEELKILVNEFSNFARMPEANPSPSDLVEIVEETLILFSESHKDVEFVSPKVEGIPVFNLDREQIKRALINLLDNAVSAVEGRGRIEVSLAHDRLLRLVRIEVADNGVGISSEDKRRLFEPYFSTKKSGTGLGLAIVSTIVADHNGFVRVQDNQPRGTRFIIELPVRA